MHISELKLLRTLLKMVYFQLPDITFTIFTFIIIWKKQKHKYNIHTCSQIVFSTLWWSNFSQFIRFTFIFPLLCSVLDGVGGGGATVKIQVAKMSDAQAQFVYVFE